MGKTGFTGANTGAETLARPMIETAKRNGLDPQAYLADMLERINDYKINRVDELFPWNWVPLTPLAKDECIGKARCRVVTHADRTDPDHTQSGRQDHQEVIVSPT